MASFERWEKLGIELEKPNDGILLIVSGDFNDGDTLEETWNFEYDDIGFVMWLLKHYEQNGYHWDEDDTLEEDEKELLGQYVPKATDTGMEISVHTIHEAHAYILENGECREIKASESSYEVPSTDSLYESYSEY